MLLSVMCTSTQGRFLPKSLYIYFFISTIYIPSNSHLGQVWGNAIGRVIVLAGSVCLLGFHQWQKYFVCRWTALHFCTPPHQHFGSYPKTKWFIIIPRSAHFGVHYGKVPKFRPKNLLQNMATLFKINSQQYTVLRIKVNPVKCFHSHFGWFL